MRTSLLVLADFTPASQRALSYANTLATAVDARLVLLHVQRDSVLDPALLTGLLPHRSQQEIDRGLVRAVRDLTVPAVTETRHGRVADAVADALVWHPSALLVLGRPNEGSIPDELITTTALDLLRVGALPMLVVPLHAPIGAAPRRVLLAVDAEPFALSETQDAIRTFFHALPAQITVVHVSAEPDAPTAATAFAAATQLPLVADLPPPHTTTVRNPVVADGILQAASTGHFDLIVLIARPRSFLGELFHHSVTAEVLLHSALPVLVLPAQ